MNITFLVGNGFDLGLGLCSRYTDFYDIYLGQSFNKAPAIFNFAKEISGNHDTWSDFESAIGEYTSNYTSSNKREFIDIIKDFTVSFVNYLEKQEGDLSFEKNQKQIIDTFTKALSSFYSLDNLSPQSYDSVASLFQKNANQQHIYNFLVFNYTSTLEKCLKLCSDKGSIVRSNGVKDAIGQIVHVHGKINDQPIIGVNDSEQIKSIELSGDRAFIKRFAKPDIDQMLARI